MLIFHILFMQENVLGTRVLGTRVQNPCFDTYLDFLKIISIKVISLSSNFEVLKAAQKINSV
jgi:hypothetical protein